MLSLHRLLGAQEICAGVNKLLTLARLTAPGRESILRRCSDVSLPTGGRHNNQWRSGSDNQANRAGLAGDVARRRDNPPPGFLLPESPPSRAGHCSNKGLIRNSCKTNSCVLYYEGVDGLTPFGRQTKQLRQSLG
jgi:hypothetical protein